MDEGKKGMENALRTKPLEVKEQYERQLRELQEAYGEAMLELRARGGQACTGHASACLPVRSLRATLCPCV